jgi:hypothetical protein
VGRGSPAFLCGIAGVIVCAHGALIAQEQAASPQRSTVNVSFVGCRSDGQTGPVEAPKRLKTFVRMVPKVAREFAYYQSAQGVGVFAPRGWFCFGTYGSGGDALFVSPEAVNAAKVFSPDHGFAGPAIEISHRFGDTSGRFDVAEIVARVFPAFKSFVERVANGSQSASPFTFGPYPEDKLTYKSEAVVEYETPPQAEGLGTHSLLRKNASPIDGVAILIGKTPDLLLLSVRLPPDLTALTVEIVRQAERDAERRSANQN